MTVVPVTPHTLLLTVSIGLEGIDPSALRGRDVILVEDIVDTGELAGQGRPSRFHRSLPRVCLFVPTLTGIAALCGCGGVRERLRGVMS